MKSTTQSFTSLDNGLWPLPTRAEWFDALVPVRLPGATHDSSKRLLELLKDNHKKYHMYFNYEGFHK
ncbi:uncharacterized protein EI90DRAFT_3051733 [Cantharellus anzutake]|uniref:uncharacterized protein n=1 Tax=Cantharellus anzutake TaxID=1750568 RepID=UPI00190321E6|nr:uncharacterized protein EI90DRAFT_3051733 [Cantharellus anzutake]KAF8334300.1 hypothetical protein EI90DRAFT_3051733 [Cantharellus anzutake]